MEKFRKKQMFKMKFIVILFFLFGYAIASEKNGVSDEDLIKTYNQSNKHSNDEMDRRVKRQTWGGEQRLENNEERAPPMQNEKFPRPVQWPNNQPNQMPTGQMSTGQMPVGQMPAGQMPTGQMSAGQMPTGQMPTGQMPTGQMPPLSRPPPSQQPTVYPISNNSPGSGYRPFSGQTPERIHPIGDYPTREERQDKMKIDGNLNVRQRRELGWNGQYGQSGVEWPRNNQWSGNNQWSRNNQWSENNKWGNKQRPYEQDRNEFGYGRNQFGNGQDGMDWRLKRSGNNENEYDEGSNENYNNNLQGNSRNC